MVVRRRRKVRRTCVGKRIHLHRADRAPPPPPQSLDETDK